MPLPSLPAWEQEALRRARTEEVVTKALWLVAVFVRGIRDSRHVCACVWTLTVGALPGERREWCCSMFVSYKTTVSKRTLDSFTWMGVSFPSHQGQYGREMRPTLVSMSLANRSRELRFWISCAHCGKQSVCVCMIQTDVYVLDKFLGDWRPFEGGQGNVLGISLHVVTPRPGDFLRGSLQVLRLKMSGKTSRPPPPPPLTSQIAFDGKITSSFQGDRKFFNRQFTQRLLLQSHQVLHIDFCS